MLIFGRMVVVIKKKTSLRKVKAALNRDKRPKSKGFDASKHLGKWKLDEDALVTQKRLRNEWD